MNSRRPPGSSYFRIDFHIHTPGSHDYPDKDVTADEVVNKAIELGLDAIAITDHNHFSWIDRVKEAAVGTGLTVFPGVELSTRDGHLLVIFDPSSTGETVRDYLSKCDLDLESFGDPNANCGLPIEEAATLATKRGGLAIGAHVDQRGGFLENLKSAPGQTRIKAFTHEAICAVEIVNEDLSEEFQAGRLYDHPKCCVQGSDAHALAEIGRRYTWVRIAKPSIQALRLAFSDPVVRIRLPRQYNGDRPRSWIEKMQVSQGFLGDIEFTFNPGLNCIVGGQGVGKSALIEFLRFALDNVSDVDGIQRDHESKLEKLLHVGGVISVTIRTDDESRFVVSRRYDGDANPISIAEIETSGELRDYPLEQNIRRYYPILAYSQGEGMSIARDALKQLDLIDGHLDLASEEDRIDELLDSLHKNAKEVVALEAHLEDASDLRKQQDRVRAQIKAIAEKINKIEAAKKIPEVAQRNLWMDEQRYLQSLRTDLETARGQLDRAISSVRLDGLLREMPTSQLGNDEDLSTVHGLAKEAVDAVSELQRTISETLRSIHARMGSEPEQWIRKWRAHDDAYRKAIESIDDVEIGKLHRDMEIAKEQREALQTRLSRAQEDGKRRRALLESRTELLNSLEQERKRITFKRKHQAEAMRKALNGRVLVSVVPKGNRETFGSWLKSNLRSQRVHISHITAICESNLEPRQLAQLAQEADWETLATSCGISDTVARNVITELRTKPDLIYDVDHIHLEDLPRIQLRKLDGKHKPLEELSTGQKFTVIILLALTDNVKPIVYDQPEDALDTAMIYSDIAKSLRESKDSRQFIFATHNSNMSVAADLDLAIVLEGSSDQASIAGHGGLEESGVNKLLVKYLEGGEEAIQQRMRKYQLDDRG